MSEEKSATDTEKSDDKVRGTSFPKNESLRFFLQFQRIIYTYNRAFMKKIVEKFFF